MKSISLALAFWLLASLFMLQGCSYQKVTGCHPGQHTCQTDAECEDEEAYFLDVEEGKQR